MITPDKNFWKIFKETNGALSCAEALAIINLVSQMPTKQGICMELGVHKGKSAMAFVYGVTYDCTFILVEPEFKNIDWWDEVEEKLNQVEQTTNSYVRVANFSINEIPECDNYSWVFVDSGSHQDGLPMQEVKLLEDRMVQDGIIVFHDFRNQFREPAEAAEYLVGTGKYEWVEINWDEIFDYVKEHDLENGNNSWHLYPELPHPPNFVGAVRRK